MGNSRSKTRQSGGAAAVEPLPSRRWQRNSERTNEAGQGDSNTRGDEHSESPEPGSFSKQAVPPQWLGFRKIFVQYFPGKPHTLTEFGALLYSHHDRHEFRAIDGSGLAKAVGLRNRDVLLSINNPQANLANAQQLAVLECFSDIGTSIGLVVKRKQEEAWLFAFHLNEKSNRPVVENIFSQRIDSESQAVSFPYFIHVVPVNSSSAVNPVYAYQSSTQVQLVLENGNRYMQIGAEMATYVPRTRRRLFLNIYQQIYGVNKKGTPVAISISSTSTSDDDSGIKAIGSGPLDVVVFPPHMTQLGTPIPQNDMFFILEPQTDGTAVFKAANTQAALYIASDIQSPTRWIASLGLPPSTFQIVRDGRVLTSREDILKLFTGQDG